MNEEICGKCSREDRKRMGYLCDKIKVEDGLPVRCIHSQSVLKLKILKYYLEIFSVAMRNKFENMYFVDLFSGPGLCYDRDNKEFYPGSPLIAMGLKYQFSKYIFVDLDANTSQILQKRCFNGPEDNSKQVTYLDLDANSNIGEILSHLKLKRSISVFFIDPNGLDIEFDVIKKLSESDSIDLIINFSIFDLKRNEHIYRDDNSKADKFFGLPDWRNEESRDWLRLYKRQLGRLGFAGVEGNNERHITVKTPTGASIYHLIYASKKELGLKFWRSAKNKFSGPSIDFVDQIRKK
ncbi:MAG: three-Cys-motif partner protein TcmP [Candidatus Helarchaeota archaeon]